MADPVLPPLPEKPVISVLTTVYQHERFLTQALDSVLSQDWPEDQLEYVVINDGSTDSSVQILEQYAAAYPRMRVIHQENQGLRAAVNRAMDELSGDFIRCVSGDDILPPGALRTAAEHLIANPHVGLLYTDMTMIGDDGRLLHPSFMEAHRLTPHTGRPVDQLIQGNFVSGGGVMIRGALKDLVHPIPDHAAWEDYWWAWQISSVADIDYLPVSTYLYRMHGSNLALGATGERLTFAQGEELRFRRWMLRNLEPGQVSVPAALNGVAQIGVLTSQIVAATAKTPEEILLVSDEWRETAVVEADQAIRAGADGDLESATLHMARALALDPHRPEMAQLYAELRAVVFAPAPQPAPAPEPIAAVPEQDLRSLVLVADADELLAAPDLLATYAGVIAPDTDATLIIHAVDWSPARVANDLGDLLERCGIRQDAAPDLLAHAGPAGDRPALVERAHAVLSDADAPGTRIGSGDAASLQQLLEVHASRPAAA
ncbi:MAG: glycosyltransferase [Solirubrobacteraceae bacterium]|nr:glycosyltransferase [Solirubrobacteraceae bacterium]